MVSFTRGRFRLEQTTSGAILLGLKHSDELVLRIHNLIEAKQLEDLLQVFIDAIEAKAAARESEPV